MRIVLSAILIFHSIQTVQATVQMPEKLVLRGIEYSLYSYPMRKFFDEHPGVLPQYTYLPTSLGRGYVATYEIIDDALFVIDIEVMTEKIVLRSVMNYIFPDSTKPIFVSWYSGLLIVPHGERDTNFFRDVRYSDYIIFKVKEGKIVSEKNLNRKQYERLNKKIIRKIRRNWRRNPL
ncbi:MAG: hypothetical protein LIO85_08545 [Rikenellaceae bacterium]|nr:hypothetical protein [Rikenellaceae bacterium]